MKRLFLTVTVACCIFAVGKRNEHFDCQRFGFKRIARF